MGFSDTDLFCRFAVVGPRVYSFLSTRILSISSNCGQPGLSREDKQRKIVTCEQEPWVRIGASSSLWIDFASDNDAGEQCGPPGNRSPTPNNQVGGQPLVALWDPVCLDFDTVLNPACCLVHVCRKRLITASHKSSRKRAHAAALLIKLVLLDGNVPPERFFSLPCMLVMPNVNYGI